MAWNIQNPISQIERGFLYLRKHRDQVLNPTYGQVKKVSKIGRCPYYPLAFSAIGALLKMMRRTSTSGS
jgi:hypothetical protein